MKTSNKILVIYGAVLVAAQLVFLINSVVQYRRLKPQGIEMCEALSRTGIHHIEIDISQAAYQTDKRRGTGREYGPQVCKSESYRYFYFGANLPTSHISNDTLYIKALNDDVSWRISQIPELRSSTIITTDETVTRSY